MGWQHFREECRVANAGGRTGKLGVPLARPDYYNAPGRLAVFRQQFGSATHQPAMDPATFATELGIILRAFGRGLVQWWSLPGS